jgi:hypothetical protein
MIPPKLGDAWIPKILISVGKESHHAILYLGSSINILSKELYDLLDLDKKLEKCDIDLLLADDSTKHALGRINDVMIELHITFFTSLFSHYGHEEQYLQSYNPWETFLENYRCSY